MYYLETSLSIRMSPSSIVNVGSESFTQSATSKIPAPSTGVLALIPYHNYITSLHEAFTKADIDSFLGLAVNIYNDIIYDINTIKHNESFENMMELIMCIDNYKNRTFTYIYRVKDGKEHKSDITLDTIFKMLTDMTMALLDKLKLNYSFSDILPSFQSDKSELDAKQLEINNAIMLAIKHISGRK